MRTVLAERLRVRPRRRTQQVITVNKTDYYVEVETADGVLRPWTYALEGQARARYARAQTALPLWTWRLVRRVTTVTEETLP